MNNMNGYHDLNLKVDVLLMVRAFETFRNASINSFGKDPAHYLSSPSYSCNAVLRFTDVNLRLISDIEKYYIMSKHLLKAQ